MVMCSFLRLFLKNILGSQQNWGTEISHVSPVLTHTWPTPLSTSPTRVAHLLQSMNLHWHIVVIQSPKFTLQFTLSVMHPMGLDKCLQNYSECFHCPKHSLCSAYSFLFSPTHPQSLATTDIFTISIVVAFPECYIWNHNSRPLF